MGAEYYRESVDGEERFSPMVLQQDYFADGADRRSEASAPTGEGPSEESGESVHPFAHLLVGDSLAALF